MLLALVLGAAPAPAATLRWGGDADLRSLDPYSGQELFLRSFDANIYEPLVRRGRDLALEPALATSWSQTAPERWRFALREGVVFQDGTPFTAADVIFSFARLNAPGSRLGGLLASVKDVRALDERTVEFVTAGADPLLPEELADWPIMSKAWCLAHGAAAPADPARGSELYANDHADGTGPFMLARRRPEAETVLVPNPRWWDKREDNLDAAIFMPAAAPDLVKSLLAGTLDLIMAVPPDAVDRIARAPGKRLVHGPELRTIFLGFDQARDKLLMSDVADRNPFKDRRVREAVARAIDEDAIAAKVMRGFARPAALLVGPGIGGYDAALDRRLPYDPARARQLLAEAGFPKGFMTGMDCPSDRYINDEAICQEVAAMLGEVGITVKLLAQDRAKFFAKVLPPKRSTSFYLLGWTPETYDAAEVLRNLAATPDSLTHAGDYNLGGYSNPALDKLIGAAQRESDRGKRQALLRQALLLVRDEVAYVPLHQQELVWAARDGVELVQRADGSFPLRFVRIE